MIDNEDIREHERVIDDTADRPGLEALRAVYERRLHRQSDDFVATDARRFVAAKLQRLPYGPSVVTVSS